MLNLDDIKPNIKKAEGGAKMRMSNEIIKLKILEKMQPQYANSFQLDPDGNQTKDAINQESEESSNEQEDNAAVTLAHKNALLKKSILSRKLTVTVLSVSLVVVLSCYFILSYYLTI